jgi:RHS repeat-associated protein
MHPEHLNTPRLIADSTGTPVWKWDQAEPFGVNTADENPSSLGAFEFPLRFPGQYADKETNVSYNYLRDCYDPVLGRYCQSDPSGLDGGISTYAYVDNNPISFTDPEGLKPLPVRPPSTREMVRHPELIRYPPAIRENPGIRDVFMEYAKGGSDFLKGYRESFMAPWLREQGIDSPNRRMSLPPIAPGCIYICRPNFINSCGVGPDCVVWCGPSMSAP